MEKIRMRITLVLIISIVLLLSTNSICFSSTQLFEDFEQGIISDIWLQEFAAPYSGQITDKRAASGKYSFRVELNKDDPEVFGSKRAEIALSSEKPLEEHWYAVSIFLPDDEDENFADDAEENRESLVQWHNIPDEGEEYTSPPLALVMLNGNYYINQFWDDAPITTTERMLNNKTFRFNDLGPYANDKGKWVRWLFHVKWGWSESQNPKLEVFKDGKLVLNRNGLPNTTNDKNGVYMKVGINKWGWKEYPELSITNKRVVYYDDISIDSQSDIFFYNLYLVINKIMNSFQTIMVALSEPAIGGRV